MEEKKEFRSVKCLTERVEAQKLLQNKIHRPRRSTKSKTEAQDEAKRITITAYKRKPKTGYNRHKLQIELKDMRLIKCEICSTMLKSAAYFKRHMQTRHPKIVKVFICDNCGKSFDHKDYLRTHIDRHRRHQILICTLCQKSYISKATFRRHLKTVS